VKATFSTQVFLVPGCGLAHDLEDRLIGLAQRACAVAEGLPRTVLGAHIMGQLLRSGTSPAANYAEARSAESRRDFVHRISICLKELRETHVWLELSRRLKLGRVNDVESALREADQLIAIFVASIKTAKRNGRKEGRVD
jgi:four helix bundle protein